MSYGGTATCSVVGRTWVRRARRFGRPPGPAPVPLCICAHDRQPYRTGSRRQHGNGDIDLVQAGPNQPRIADQGWLPAHGCGHRIDERRRAHQLPCGLMSERLPESCAEQLQNLPGTREPRAGDLFRWGDRQAIYADGRGLRHVAHGHRKQCGCQWLHAGGAGSPPIRTVDLNADGSVAPAIRHLDVQLTWTDECHGSHPPIDLNAGAGERGWKKYTVEIPRRPRLARRWGVGQVLTEDRGPATRGHGGRETAGVYYRRNPRSSGNCARDDEGLFRGPGASSQSGAHRLHAPEVDPWGPAEDPLLEAVAHVPGASGNRPGEHFVSPGGPADTEVVRQEDFRRLGITPGIPGQIRSCFCDRRKYVMEATAAYFFDRERPERIRLHLVRDEIFSVA